MPDIPSLAARLTDPDPAARLAAAEQLAQSGEAAAPAAALLVKACGDADDHSDVDLLVIKPHVADRYEEIIELDRSLAGILIPVDILLVSESEFEERADQPGTVERAARQEGRVLYAA